MRALNPFSSRGIATGAANDQGTRFNRRDNNGLNPTSALEKSVSCATR